MAKPQSRGEDSTKPIPPKNASIAPNVVKRVWVGHHLGVRFEGKNRFT